MREKCIVRDDVGDGDGASAATTSSLALPLPRGLRGGSKVGNISIADLIAEKINSKTFFWSAELIPGTSPQLQSLLQHSLDQIGKCTPLFVSVTWHVGHLRETESAGGVSVMQHPALELCKHIQDTYGIPALMHLAAGRMKRLQVQGILEACHADGVMNILALRGDDKPEPYSDFQNATDLVHFIRNLFGSTFNIGVAGYPLGHPDAQSAAQDLFFLKKKVDAGADFILTQMITSFEEFHTFKENCSKLGVKIPIIPGLILIQTYDSLKMLVRLCNVKVPMKIFNEFKNVNKKKTGKYGENLLKNIMKSLILNSSCPGFHLFTMNKVNDVFKIISDMEILQEKVMPD